MKIVPIDIIKSMSGKVCGHSDTSISLNSSSGRMHTSKLCNPYTGPATAKQLAQQSKFKTLNEKATTWLNANKELRDSDGNVTRQMSSDYKKALQMKVQMGLSNVRQVICKYMDASGNVDLTSPSPSEGGVTNQPTAKKTLTLTVSPAGGGTVTGDGQYDVNATASITATAASGYTFKKWNDGDTNSSRSVTMTDDMTLQAVFETTTSGGSSENSGGSGCGSNNNP